MNTPFTLGKYYKTTNGETVRITDVNYQQDADGSQSTTVGGHIGTAMHTWMADSGASANYCFALVPVEVTPFEVGKSYLTVDGDVATINSIDQNSEFPVKGSIKDISYSWTSGGKYFSGDGVYRRDLTSVEYVASPQTPRFEVGKSYLTVCGDVLRIVCVDYFDDYPIIAVEGHGMIRTYTSNGKRHKNESPSALDLTDVECSAAASPFEVGKSYKTRCGDIARINLMEEDLNFPLRGTLNHNGNRNGNRYNDCWKLDGRYTAGFGDHDLDLIPGAVESKVPIMPQYGTKMGEYLIRALWRILEPDDSVTNAGLQKYAKTVGLKAVTTKTLEISELT